MAHFDMSTLSSVRVNEDKFLCLRSDEVKDRRLVISPQFSVKIVDERRVLLLSEHRSFMLTGCPYVELVPLLDGTRELQALVSELTPRVSEQRVHEMLNTMLKKGYARYCDDAPAAEQAYWIECGRDPRFVRASLARFKVAVESVGTWSGANMAAAGRLTTLLGEVGVTLSSRSKADLTVVMVDDYLTPTLASWNREMRTRGQRWLPVKLGGRSPWLGPFFQPDRAPCWACLARPLQENRLVDQLVDGSSQPVRPARAAMPASLTLAHGFAAQHITRLASGERHLDEDVLSLDLRSNEIRRHKIRSVSTCEICADPNDVASERLVQPIIIRSNELDSPMRLGWRVATLDEMRMRLAPLVSPITGIVMATSEFIDHCGLHIVNMDHTAPIPVGAGRDTNIHWANGSAGVGETETQARVACIAEAAERYCCGWTGTEPRRTARLDELGDDVVTPQELLQFSERQYEGREAWNPAHGDFNHIPVPFDSNMSIDWSPAWSLTKERQKWIPTRHCYFGYAGGKGDHEFCFSDSNGCASGAILEEAILYGMLELIERDACALFWYNRVCRPQIDLDEFSSTLLDRVRSELSLTGKSLHVLDLTTDIDVPVFIAVSMHRDGSRIMIGLGSHLDARIALSRAIGELRLLDPFDAADHVMANEVHKHAVVDSDLQNWLEDATISTEPYLVPLPGAPKRLQDYELPNSMSLHSAVQTCVSRIKRAGVEVLAVDLTRPEIDLACARVIAPGLRHFWARFAPGRLYDTPVALGWLDKPTQEDDLNPRPVFV